MIEGDMKTNTSPKNNAPRDDTTRTTGVKQRHLNEKVHKAEQQERMDHVEEAEIKGLFHRQKPEKGFKK